MASSIMTSRQRILTLDLIRGYFLLVIFVDHLFRFPSIFGILTGQGQLWVSAAEFFFIISGILIGQIHSPAIKLWHRAGKLYLCSISLTLLFTLWGHFLPEELIKTGLWNGTDIFVLIFNTLTFKYIYGWTDFLAYYAVFLALAPLIILIARKFTSLTVLILSFTFWFLFRSTNHFFAWQFLFFSGMIVGQNLTSLESKIKKYLVPLNIVTLISVLLSVLFVFILKTNVANFWFDKNTLGPGRVVLAWVWFTTTYLFIRSHENTIIQLTGNFFLTLGQKSLYVYCLQAFILFPVNFLIPQQFNYFGNSLFTLIGCFLIYFLTKPLIKNLNLVK